MKDIFVWSELTRPFYCQCVSVYLFPKGVRQTQTTERKYTVSWALLTSLLVPVMLNSAYGYYEIYRMSVCMCNTKTIEKRGEILIILLSVLISKNQQNNIFLYKQKHKKHLQVQGSRNGTYGSFDYCNEDHFILSFQLQNSVLLSLYMLLTSDL